MSRLVFLGTPEAAVPALKALSAVHEIGLVITRPDQPRGRSKRPKPPPVKEAAQTLGVPIAQPERSVDVAEVISDHAPFDLGVVVAYGMLLKPEALALPARGMINVHFSLLPRWRGAAPVARAIMAGDDMTGVTIMKLDEGLDTGPVLTAQAVDIDPLENTGDLTSRLADLGARLIVETASVYLSGDTKPVTQTDEGVTYARKLESDDRPIDVRDDVAVIVNQVRALAPSPAATLRIDGEPFKIYEVQPHPSKMSAGSWSLVDGAPVVGVGDGAIELVSLQPPGKNRLDGEDWGRGLRTNTGLVR